jgi:hypothetical protein
VIDNDKAGLIVRQSGATTAVTEGTSNDTYTIALNKAPAPGEIVCNTDLVAVLVRPARGHHDS